MAYHRDHGGGAKKKGAQVGVEQLAIGGLQEVRHFAFDLVTPLCTKDYCDQHIYGFLYLNWSGATFSRSHRSLAIRSEEALLLCQLVSRFNFGVKFGVLGAPGFTNRLYHISDYNTNSRVPIPLLIVYI
jgi:hypothetical protein